MYYMEISFEYTHVIARAQFASKRRAENARKKLAAEIAKGKFKNSEDIVEIKSDTSTLTVRPSSVVLINVVDVEAWAAVDKENAAKFLGERVNG
ncbi:hypothetical protein EVC08_023 [Rhizobium phage RHph_N65]|nr:hypothetical protein EVC08_023 [Rhizobium phage RHph_N65]